MAVFLNRLETLATQTKENFASVTSIARVWFVVSDKLDILILFKTLTQLRTS